MQQISQQPFFRLPSFKYHFYTLWLEARGWSQIQAEEEIFPDLAYNCKIDSLEVEIYWT